MTDTWTGNSHDHALLWELQKIAYLNAIQVRQNVKIHHLLKKINEGVHMTTNIDAVLAAVNAIEGDTANVARVLGEVNTQVTALTAQVADLQAQIDAGTGVSAADLQAVTDRLTAADAALDTLAPDAPVA